MFVNCLIGCLIEDANYFQKKAEPLLTLLFIKLFSLFHSQTSQLTDRLPPLLETLG